MGFPKKHGLYSYALTPTEQAMYTTMRLGSVDEEIKLLRVLMMRALNTMNKMVDEENNLPEDERKAGYSLSEIKDSSGGEHPGITKTYKRMELDKVVESLAIKIASLEKTRSELLEHASADPEKMAAKLMAAIKNIKQVENAHPEMD